MTDETRTDEDQPEAPATDEPAVDLCPLCDCDDCPGTDPNSTERLAEHSKACSVKHF